MTRRDADHVPAFAYHCLSPRYDRVIAATRRERELKRALLVQETIRPALIVLALTSGPDTLAL